MKKQLYEKNERGRYVPYREPEPPFNNVLYRKVTRGNKVEYQPTSMCMTKDLGEGVWVVTKNLYGKSYASGKYLYDSFLCMKASDIQEVELSKLGGMNKLADFLCSNWDKLPKDKSLYDRCRAIVGLMFKYEKERKEKK